ncbi:hypothetical protein ACPOLB_01550 [Rubrivivax sp. RP6-9]|uniref:hypothetical protein n=1 Tax=Rubrivivax sp. RP6-9 TaxID=3415750 RepID=UPI003CC521B3
MPSDFAAAATPIELHPLPVSEAETVSGLALVGDRDPRQAPRLVLAHDVLPAGRRLAVMDLAGGAPAPLAGFLHRAAWAAAPDGPGALQVVATDNGSAGSGLRWQGADGRSSDVSSHDRFGVYDAPVFVRPVLQAPAAVAAVGLVGGRQRPVVFLPQDGGRYAPGVVLPQPRPGVVLAVRLLRVGAGHLQATLLFRPGAAPRQRTPRPADGLVQGGWLECQRLDAELRPLGDAWRPFGDGTVWEFDAEAVGDRAVLLATVDGGLALAVGVAAVGAVPPLHVPSTTALQAPAVLAAGGVLHVAALAGRASPRATVLLGQMRLP